MQGKRGIEEQREGERQEGEGEALVSAQVDERPPSPATVPAVPQNKTEERQDHHDEGAKEEGNGEDAAARKRRKIDGEDGAAQSTTTQRGGANDDALELERSMEQVPISVARTYPGDAYAHVFTDEARAEIERAAESKIPDEDDDEDDGVQEQPGDDGEGGDGQGDGDDAGNREGEVPVSVARTYPGDAYAHVFTEEAQAEVERVSGLGIPDGEGHGDERGQ